MRPPSILSSCLLLLAACGGGDSSPDPADAEAAPADGAAVYASACAMCHGANGDGQGTIPLDRPARSFRDGGFSFGNTAEAIRRTVANGIGGTPMPAFGDFLSAAQLDAVVAHVIALGPPRAEVDRATTVLAVGARAQVVRGGLPPLRDGAPAHPRGLLLGNADGTTFEYDAEDLRLVAVRQGDFVRRADWEGRGGDLLEPLGRVVWAQEGGAPGAGARLDATTALRARLAWTEVQGGSAEVGARLHDPAGRAVATWSERGGATVLGGLPGVRRSIALADGAPGAQLFLRVAPLAEVERLGAQRLRTGSAGEDLVVVEGRGGAGFEGLVEADGALHALLRLDAAGAAACEIDLIPVATAEAAEALRQEGF